MNSTQKEHTPDVPKNGKTKILIVNTRECEWEKQDISYEEVIVLAFGAYSEQEGVAYSVIYSRGNGSDKEGALVKGKSVKAKDGMIFNVTQTNKS